MKFFRIIFLFISLAVVALFSRAQTSSKDMIKKYNRVMVFSNAAIVPGSENTSSLITEYQTGDELYYRVYMDSSMKQFIDKWRYSNSPLSRFKYLDFLFYIDDKYVAEYKKKLNTVPDEEFKNISSFGSSMESSAESDDAYSLNAEFKTFMNSQSEKLKGDHIMKILVYMYDNQYIYQLFATGRLKVKSNQESLAKMAGINGDFHKTHLKKMFFSSRPISDEPGPADIITQYNIGQPLYYKVFMDNTIDNYRKKYQYSSSYKNIYLRFYVDGTQIKEDFLEDFGPLSMTEDEEATLTTFGGLAMTDADIDLNKEKHLILWPFHNFLINNNKMLSGTHKLKLEVYLYAQGLNLVSELLGEGELTITLGQISATHPLLGYTPKAVISDPPLEAKLIAAYNEEFEGKAVATKAYLMFKDWDVVKNEYTGALICKVRSANMKVKTSSGSCMYAEVSFKMDYEGGGKYGRIQFGNLITGGYHPVLCECLK